MKKIIFALLFVVLATSIYASEEVCIAYFYSKTCGHCQSIKPFLDEVEETYGDRIGIHRLDVATPGNMSLFTKFCTDNDYSGRGVPTLGINDKILIGTVQIREQLIPEIERALASDIDICPIDEANFCPLHNSTGIAQTDPVLSGVDDLKWYSIIPLILFTGLGDGINPCAFAVLIFIMAFLQQISKNKKRLVKITVAYVIAVLTTNIGLGVLYYYTSVQIGFPLIIRYIAIALAIIAGAINIKDFFFYGKGFSLRIPKKSKRAIEGLAQKATLSSAIVLGGLVALLEAPCSIPIYLTVLEVLKGSGYGIIGVMPYILLYNLMFIIPLLFVAGMVYYGTQADALEKWRTKYRRWMKLSIGLILIGLAMAMLFGWL